MTRRVTNDQPQCCRLSLRWIWNELTRVWTSPNTRDTAEEAKETQKYKSSRTLSGCWPLSTEGRHTSGGTGPQSDGRHRPQVTADWSWRLCCCPAASDTPAHPQLTLGVKRRPGCISLPVSLCFPSLNGHTGALFLHSGRTDDTSRLCVGSSRSDAYFPQMCHSRWCV